MTFNFMMEKHFICYHKIGGMDNTARPTALPKTKTATGRRPRSPPSKADIDAGQFVHKLFGIVIVL